MTEANKHDPRFDLSIHCVLTTVTPLTFTLPGDNGKKSEPKTKKNEPKPLPRFADRYGYSATGFSGVLRRQLLKEVMKGLEHRDGGAWTVDQVMMNMLGGVNGFAKTDGVLTPKIYRERREQNPLLSLFGESRLHGLLGISNLLAPPDFQCPGVQQGVRTLSPERDDAALGYLPVEEIARLQARLDLDSHSSGVKKDIKELKREIARDRRAAKTDDDRAKVTEKEQMLAEGQPKKGHVPIRNPFSGYEFIPPDTTLTGKIMASGLTLPEVGYLLAALRAFAANPRLGGHLRHGCGWVMATLQVRGRESGSVRPMQDWGTIAISFEEGFALQDEGCEQTARAALAQFDAELEAGFPGRDFRAHAEDIMAQSAEEEEVDDAA